MQVAYLAHGYQCPLVSTLEYFNRVLFPSVRAHVSRQSEITSGNRTRNRSLTQNNQLGLVGADFFVMAERPSANSD